MRFTFNGPVSWPKLGSVCNMTILWYLTVEWCICLKTIRILIIIVVAVISSLSHYPLLYFMSKNDQSNVLPVLLNLLVSLLPLPSCFHLLLLQCRALGLGCQVGLKASHGEFTFEVAESKCFLSALSAPCVIGFHGSGMSFVKISYFCTL